MTATTLGDRHFSFANLHDVRFVGLVGVEIPLQLTPAQIGFAETISLKTTYRVKIFLAIFWFSRSILSSSALRALK